MSTGTSDDIKPARISFSLHTLAFLFPFFVTAVCRLLDSPTTPTTHAAQSPLSVRRLRFVCRRLAASGILQNHIAQEGQDQRRRLPHKRWPAPPFQLPPLCNDHPSNSHLHPTDDLCQEFRLVCRVPAARVQGLAWPGHPRRSSWLCSPQVVLCHTGSILHVSTDHSIRTQARPNWALQVPPAPILHRRHPQLNIDVHTALASRTLGCCLNLHPSHCLACGLLPPSGRHTAGQYCGRGVVGSIHSQRITSGSRPSYRDGSAICAIDRYDGAQDQQRGGHAEGAFWSRMGCICSQTMETRPLCVLSSLDSVE